MEVNWVVRGAPKALRVLFKGLKRALRELKPFVLFDRLYSQCHQ